MSLMRKILVIALRDYSAAVRTKAFVVSLVIMPIMMGGSFLLQWLLRDYRDLEEKRFVVLDRTAGASFVPLLQAAVATYNEKATVEGGKQIKPHFWLDTVAAAEAPTTVEELREQLSLRVKKGELYGFVEVGPDVFQPRSEGATNESSALRYQSNRPPPREWEQLVEQVVTRAVQEERCRKANLKYPDVQNVMTTVVLDSKGLTTRDPATGVLRDGVEQNPLTAFIVPFLLIMLMFMVIMLGAAPGMQGVVEEKMQRIAEVLLGSVAPFELMLGKLLGLTGISLTITSVYLGGAYWTAQRYGYAEFIPVAVLFWFILFQTLATLMYGSLFIAIGAACTDMKETQNLLWPVMLLACLPMFFLRHVLQEPNSTVATAASFFPFATPMLMVARQAVPPGTPWWQPVAGALGVLLTTLICVYVAGRIFRVGLLLQGKGARLGDMVRWVFRG
jgi:ABC-type Na+ efflux pump permease subunit